MNPPILFLIDTNQQLALLTRNQYVINNGLDIIDPDFMFGVLYELACQQRSNSNEQFSNTYNLRAQEIAAEQGRQLADAYAEASINQAQASADIMTAIFSRPATHYGSRFG